MWESFLRELNRLHKYIRASLIINYINSAIILIAIFCFIYSKYDAPNNSDYKNQNVTPSVKVDAKDSLSYLRAITFTKSPDAGKIYKNLRPILLKDTNLLWDTAEGEKYVLTLNLASGDYCVTNPNSTKCEIWVNLAPDLKNRFKELATTNIVQDTLMRLRQLLGLPPNDNKKFFYEIWVKPTDLFRPCRDNEINDCQCDMEYPSNADVGYMNWFGNLINKSYYDAELFKNYPFTQLGYSYDWNESDTLHIGLSEYIIRAGSKIRIKNIYTINEYLK